MLGDNMKGGYIVLLLAIITTASTGIALADEQNFTSNMTQPNACIPNSPDVRGNLVYVCAADGSGYVLALNCQGETTPIFDANNASVNGGYSCKTATVPTPIGFVKASPGFDVVLSIISITALLVLRPK
jgi:hypothetical protein